MVDINLLETFWEQILRKLKMTQFSTNCLLPLLLVYTGIHYKTQKEEKKITEEKVTCFSIFKNSFDNFLDQLAYLKQSKTLFSKLVAKLLLTI